MNNSTWSGPWLTALSAHGKPQPVLLPRPGAAAAWPRDTTKITVRWRHPGAANPRKRTFDVERAEEALELARRVSVATLLGLAPGPGGLPSSGLVEPCTDDLTPPAAAVPHAGTTEVFVCAEVPTSTVSGRASSPLMGAGDLLPQAPQPLHLRLASGGRSHWPAPGGELGPTVEEWVAHLKVEHGAVWEERGNTFMSGQLDLLVRFFAYDAGDPRVAHFGLEPGSSMHLWLLEPGDFAVALVQRRQVNFAAERRNRLKKERYAKALERYQAAQGRPGRRPDLPQAPVLERATRSREETTQDAAVAARTEKAFANACTFVMDRADERRMFPGRNPWRVFNPRRNGGRARVAPVIRTPDAGSSTSRRWPGLGFFADLGDVLALQGQQLAGADESRTQSGERYRVLPMVATTLILRPGEGGAARPEYLRDGDFEVAPLPGRRLKHREIGETRSVPAGTLVAHLMAAHCDAGYCSKDGYLFSGPAGGRLDVSNFSDDFLRPALRVLLSPGGLWDDHAELLGEHDGWYLMRKSGQSILLAHGLDPATAARWAGHGEDVMYSHYKGQVSSGRTRQWLGVDGAWRDALTEQPPRGVGQLARSLRGYAGVSET